VRPSGLLKLVIRHERSPKPTRDAIVTGSSRCLFILGLAQDCSTLQEGGAGERGFAPQIPPGSNRPKAARIVRTNGRYLRFKLAKSAVFNSVNRQ
jgi:hypothetical protein